MESEVVQNEGGGELGNIESLLTPISYSEETPFPRDIPGKPSVPSTVHFRGRVSNDCQWGWITSQSVIRVFPIVIPDESTNTCKSPLCVCTEPYQFPGDCFITCSNELLLHNPKLVNGVSKLVVGLNFRNSSGGLVIFDPLRAQPMKLILLPSPVTSVAVVSHFEDVGFNSHFFNEAMMAMVGVVAVGMIGGEVTIIDLGLDQLKLHNPSQFNYKNVFAKAPFTPCVVEAHEDNVALKRHEAVKDKQLIALSAYNESEDDTEFATNSFYYSAPNKQTIKVFPRKNVRVTALEYIPATGLLIVGFDFGGFQIWRVDTMDLVYSSSVSTRSNGIFGFSYSQPIDDPKNYSYLWVMYGKAGLEFGYSHVELYCLDFEEKTVIKKLGFLYKRLIQCIQKLSFKLEDAFDQESLEDNSDENRRFVVRPLKIWTHATGNLTFFSWESSRPGIYYVGIFDLNQWYSNRMLDCIRILPDNHLCPYWVAIPVEAVDEYKSIPIYDLQLVPKSLERWENPFLKLDIHFYPASLSFRAVTLSQCATSTFQFFGVQEKLIRKLIQDGTNIMINPNPIKKLFKLYGVRPILRLKYDQTVVSKEVADRFFIFTTLLDNRRPAIIIKFAANWLDGALANFGCTVDLILTWISAYTHSLRQMAENHWIDLNQCYLEYLAPETRMFIHYSNFVWQSLSAVFTTITRPDEVFSTRERFINNLTLGLNKVIQYSAALVMLFNAELLPEREGKDIAADITRAHETIRSEVIQAVERCPLFDCNLKKVRPMMIDYLLEAFDEDLLREQWHIEQDQPLYPPKHVGYILNMFLWDHDEPKDIARVAAYFFMDIRDAVGEEQKEKFRGDFNSIIQLTAVEQAEIYHLWLIDQGYREQGLTFLSQQERLYSDTIPWCAGVAVCAAFGQEDDVMHLLQRDCPLPLSSLYINLMCRSLGLYCNTISSITFGVLCTNEEFLLNFFRVSEMKDYLKEFIQRRIRHIQPFVVQTLIKFLNQNPSFRNDERLLIIYTELGDWENLREQLARTKYLYEGRLYGEDEERWKLREPLVQAILERESNPSSRNLMDFIRKDKTSFKLGRAKTIQTVTIRPQQVPVTPKKTDSPLQHPRLKMMKAKPNNPLSPLRRYAAKLHSVMTPSRSTVQSDDINTSMNESPPEEAIVIDDVLNPMTPGTSRLLMSLCRPNTEDSEDDEDLSLNASNVFDEAYANQSRTSYEDAMQSVFERTGMSSNSNPGTVSSPDPVNLESLLKPPPVDHRKSRLSISFLGPSIPSSNDRDKEDANNTCLFSNSVIPSEEIHSILKVKNSMTRRSLELRFFDVSKNILDEGCVAEMSELANGPSPYELSIIAESSMEFLSAEEAKTPIAEEVEKPKKIITRRSSKRARSPEQEETAAIPSTTTTPTKNKKSRSQTPLPESVLDVDTVIASGVVRGTSLEPDQVVASTPPKRKRSKTPVAELEADVDTAVGFRKTRRRTPSRESGEALFVPASTPPKRSRSKTPVAEPVVDVDIAVASGVVCATISSFEPDQVVGATAFTPPKRSRSKTPLPEPVAQVNITVATRKTSGKVSGEADPVPASTPPKRLRSRSNTPVAEPEADVDSAVGSRKTRGKTPSLESSEADPVPASTPSKRTRSKTPVDEPVADVDSAVTPRKTRGKTSSESGESDLVPASTPPKRTRSKTPVAEPDADVDILVRRGKTPSLEAGEADPVPASTPSKRSRSKTPLPELEVDVDIVIGSRKTRAKTPSLESGEADPVPASTPQKRTRSKTPVAEPEADVDSAVGSRKTRGRTPSLESDEVESVTTKVKKGPRPIRGFMPELSTVIEDPSSLSILSDISLLDATITPISGGSRFGTRSRTRAKSVSDGEQEKTPPKKRTRKAKPVDDVFEDSMANDDDVPSTRNLRSTRSASKTIASRPGSRTETRAMSVDLEDDEQEKTPSKKRTLKSKPVDDVFEDSMANDDEAGSDVPSARRNRSTRSASKTIASGSRPGSRTETRAMSVDPEDDKQEKTPPKKRTRRTKPVDDVFQDSMANDDGTGSDVSPTRNLRKKKTTTKRKASGRTRYRSAE